MEMRRRASYGQGCVASRPATTYETAAADAWRRESEPLTAEAVWHRGQPLHAQQRQRLHGDEKASLFRLRLCGIAASYFL